MDELIDYVDEKNIAVGQLERFLNVAYRIKSEKLKRLTTKERTFFWQRMIWQKYHRRVNENLGNFAVIEYQNYFYLYKKQNISEVKKQVISLNQPFVFKNRKMVLYTERKAGIKLIGDFWFKPNTAFSVGELTAGSKLLLQNGHHVKAKEVCRKCDSTSFTTILLSHLCRKRTNFCGENLSKPKLDQKWQTLFSI